MITVYQIGADYIVMFNYPILEGIEYDLMNDGHFFALERFWNDAAVEKKVFFVDDMSTAGAALVLPENYGWG
jgi:hypothetical protein